jgi:hypothetical protein
VIAFYPDGTEKIFKLLSSDPKNYSDAANEAIRCILEDFENRKLEKNVPLDLSNIGKSESAPAYCFTLIIPRFASHGNHRGNECIAGEARSENSLVHYQGIQGLQDFARKLINSLIPDRTC